TDAGRPFRVGSLAEVQLQTVAPTNQHQTCFWFSTYCLIAARGAPPVVATKYEFVQSIGSRLRRCGNSCRSACEERPFIAPTSRCTPNCGSTSTSRSTWSGITSKAWSHAPCSWITSARTVFKRSSTGGTSTERRYFGDQTTWKAHWKTTLWLERKIGPAIYDYTAPRNLSGRRTRSEEHTSELQSRGHLVCRLLLEK